MKGRVEKLGPDFRHLKPRLRAPRKSDWPSPSISLTLLITLSFSVVSTFTDDVPKSSPFRWCSRVLVFPLMFHSLSLPTDTTLHSLKRPLKRIYSKNSEGRTWILLRYLSHGESSKKKLVLSASQLAQHVSREFRMSLMETYDVLCLVFRCVMRNRLCRMNVRCSWIREAKRGWFGEFTM